MTLPVCEQVAERVALGEALGELAEHAASCEHCRRLVAMPGKLAATHHAVDPGLGFSARMTVGARHRLAARHRFRLAVGLVATVATGGFGVFLVTRAPDEPRAKTVEPMIARPDPEPAPTPDDDLAALVQLADTDSASRVSANWHEIKKPLAPYRKLLAGSPDEGDTP